MKTLALFLAIFAAGCAAVPEALSGTPSGDPAAVASVSIADDEIRILEVDGKALPRSGASEFTLVPGTHRLLVGLHWCPGGQCTTWGGFADKPRSACFEARAAMRYRINAGNPGPDWIPLITEKAQGGTARSIESGCG